MAKEVKGSKRPARPKRQTPRTQAVRLSGNCKSCGYQLGSANCSRSHGR